MRVKNYVRNEAGNIDCEIEHPKFGWIPFTASQADVEQHGREIYQALNGQTTDKINGATISIGVAIRTTTDPIAVQDELASLKEALVSKGVLTEKDITSAGSIKGGSR